MATLGPAQAQSVGDQLDPRTRLPASATTSSSSGPRSAADRAAACPFQGHPELNFELRGVELRGVQSLPSDVAAQAYAPLIGQTINVAQLCVIRDRLSDIYRAHDIRFVRIELPQQRISSGVVAFDVLEGFVDQVSVAGDPGPAAPLIAKTLGQMSGRRPLLWRDVERYVLLAGDVPGVTLKTTVKRGEGEPGSIDIVAKATHDRFDGFLAAQNWGSKEIGRYFVTAGVRVSGLTSAGDRQFLTLSSTLDDEQFQASWLGDIVLDPDGLVLSGRLGYAVTKPGGEVASLDFESTSVLGSLELRYAWLRGQTTNVSAYAGLDIVNQDNSVLGGEETFSNDKLRIAYAGLNARYIGEDGPAYLGQPWGAQATLEIRHGLSIFGSSDADDKNLSRLDGNPEATLVRFDAAAQFPLSDVALLSLRSVGQYAGSGLLSYEEYTVGTSNTTVGRGYDPAVVSGDHGVGGSAELRFAVPSFDESAVGFEVFTFYDVSRQWNRDPLAIDHAGRTLQSVGGGIAANLYDYNVQAELMWAEPLDKPFSQSSSVPAGRLLFNLTWKIF